MGYVFSGSGAFSDKSFFFWFGWGRPAFAAFHPTRWHAIEHQYTVAPLTLTVRAVGAPQTAHSFVAPSPPTRRAFFTLARAAASSASMAARASGSDVAARFAASASILFLSLRNRCCCFSSMGVAGGRGQKTSFLLAVEMAVRRTGGRGRWFNED